MVIRPWLLRPPLLWSGSNRLRSGSVVVTSSRSSTEYWRWLLMVGFRFLIDMALDVSGSKGRSCV
jgi:hypothetical protein